jgi:hypothetical protein
MPLLRLDIVEGLDADQTKALLSATHSALVAASQVRYEMSTSIRRPARRITPLAIVNGL